MTSPSSIVIVLALLMAAAAFALYLDARQRRMGRHVAVALTASPTEITPSIRRVQVVNKVRLLHLMANYKPGITYDFPPVYVFLGGAAAAAAVFYVNTMVKFPLLWVSVGAFTAAVVTVRGVFGSQRRRLASKLFRQLPDTIEIVTSAVRTGLPVNEAFRAIAREMPQPTAGQFAIVCNELSMGRPLEEAVENVYRRTDVPEYGFFAVTLSVQMKAGGSLAETLQTLADTVRQRVALAGRAKALAGEVIFSSRALTMAPFIVGGVLYLISPELIDLLFTDPSGKKMLAYAGTSVLTGSLVIRWMIKRDTAI